MKPNWTKHERKVGIRYLAEMSGAILFYAVVLILSIRVGRPMPASMIRTLIEVSPMIPFLLMIVVVARQFRRIDEYMKMQTLENIAIAAGITAGWTFTYGFLENAGFPRLSMFNVMPVMFWIWGALAIIRCVMDR